MSQPWLIAIVMLALAGIVYAAQRVHREYVRRLDNERVRSRRMAELHLATIEALALAIDAKDPTARNHLRSVQAHSTSVARALGMSEEEVLGVQTAAFLHDIGKLAVPEHILAKPGPLTPEEFQKVRIHPQVGADIIAGVPFPYPVAPLVLSHHERWDGRGYPSGLRGEEIPLGARILCVVGCFDALTSYRPYHTPINREAALAILRQDSGKAFDPRVVAAFGEVMGVEATDNIEVQAVEGGKETVFDDIAVAHREIYALYQVAQTMGTSLGVTDTMELISSKLTNLVPFSACAMFVHSAASDTLSCRFAKGTDSETLRQLTLRTGQGLTGWVARNRRPLVNARPSADIEAAKIDRPTVLQSALVCPLVFGEQFIGTLAVYHTQPSFYRDDHRRLLDVVSGQAAAVIHNAVLFEQTQEDSLTDPLTGLPNTRFMVMHLARELARAGRLKSEVSLVVMDLDGFKAINDNHGHHIGDRALREVANVLRVAIRPYDVCVRYAGDEFIIVLSGGGLDEVEQKRAELQQAIDRLEFEARPGYRLPLSISAGAAVFPHDGDDYESLLAIADGRMYADKSMRRNNATRQLAARTGPPPRGSRDMVPVSKAV
jgi:diguanylate cyclase (GGDEF)-like protein